MPTRRAEQPRKGRLSAPTMKASAADFIAPPRCSSILCSPRDGPAGRLQTAGRPADDAAATSEQRRIAHRNRLELSEYPPRRAGRPE